jgi:hypothetical protein
VREIVEPSRKVIIVLRAPDATGLAAFRVRARDVARSLFADAARLTVCDIDPAPDGLPRRPDDPPDSRPAYDVAVIAVFSDAAAAQLAFYAGCTADWGASPDAFLTTEIPVLDRLGPDAKPAIKNLALIQFHDDLPDSAAQRSWAQHAKLASIVHVGAGRYVRNWVTKRSPHAPPVRGIVEIDFATVADLTERYFGVPGGMERVIQDVGHFVARGTRLYMTSSHESRR